jgi:AcrR family transcriptional regulator
MTLSKIEDQANENARNPKIRRLVTEAIDLPEKNSPKGSKRDILNAALQLFAERNFAGGSVRDIAEIAGLKPASLYAHYKSKDDMLASLIDIGHTEHAERIEQSLAAAAPDPKSQLCAWVDAHVRFHAAYPMLATVINHELHALPSNRLELVSSLREKTVKWLTDIIDKGSETNEFKCGHDAWLAAASIGATGMRVANWYSTDSKHSVDEIAAAYSEFAYRIVRG